MAKYLDETGLAYFWAKIKEKLATKADTTSLPTKTSDLTNDSGFITAKDVPEGAAASNTTPKMDGMASIGSETTFARGDHVHPTDTSRLATDGDAKNTTVTFTAASTRSTIATGEKMSVLMGKIAKYMADFGSLAFKSSLTASDVGALPDNTHIPSTVAEMSDAGNYALKSDLTNVYKYKGSVATTAALPSSGNMAGDVYNVEETDMNYAWNGTAWDPLGQIFSLSSITNTDIDTVLSA